MADLTLKYNVAINQKAYLPIIGSAISVYRTVVNTSCFFSHTIKGIYQAARHQSDEAQKNLARALTDLKEVARGLIGIPPVVGGLFSLLWDHYLLSPAQKLAYRIEGIYQSRMRPFTHFEKTNLKQLTDEELRNTPAQFQEFVNGKSVMISTNQEKIDHLRRVIFDHVDYNNSIFNDPHLPFYALALFARSDSALDTLDMATILEIYMAKMCHKDCMVYPLLDEEKLDWTQEAKDRFLPTLASADLFVSPAQEPEIDALKNKIASLPPHKRLFFSHRTLIPFKEIFECGGINRLELLESSIGALYANLIRGGFIRLDIELGQEVHLSFDAESCFLDNRYGQRGSPFTPKLGLFSPRDIKKEVVDKIKRLCATFFPGVEAASEIHGSKELPGVAIIHDKSHGHILRKYQPENVNLLLSLISNFEKVTGFEMTKEIWELVDMVAISILVALPFNNNQDFFTRVLQSSGSKPGDRAWHWLFFNDSKQLGWEYGETPTLLGWIAALHIVDHPEDELWSKLRGTKNFETAILTIRSFYDQEIFNQNDEPIIKLWKLMQYAQSEPIDPSIRAEDLEFTRIRKKGFRKNMITIAKKPTKR